MTLLKPHLLLLIMLGVAGIGFTTQVSFAQESECTDLVDNDLDGDVDCADDDCFNDLRCEDVESICNDNFDNDADDLKDCMDPDCFENDLCMFPEETCDDLFDNDGDELIDCDDINDCAFHRNCGGTELDCTNGVDEDFDNRIDCDDVDCIADPACQVFQGIFKGSGGCHLIRPLS